MRIDDPWHDTLASGWGRSTAPPRRPSPGGPLPARRPPPPPASPAPAEPPSAGRAAATAASSCPLSAALLACHLAYLVAVTAVPAAAGRTLGGGPVTAGTAAGLAQFAAACLLVWAYARHTRPRGDGRVEAPEPCRCGHEPFGAAGTAAQGRGDRAR
ncbi:DUF485 domain-containing protein [Streptomyces radiopugnans]|nr:DUF485 domain-containing protein [Streptomyces radiopugnans]